MAGASASDGGPGRLLTVEVARGAEVGVRTPSPVGVALILAHAPPGGAGAWVVAYRADALGYARLLRGAGPGAGVGQPVALPDPTGEAGGLTFSVHPDGRVCVGNRTPGPPRKVTLHLIGARP